MKKITFLFVLMLSASIYAFSCDTPLNPKAFLTRTGLVSLVWERPAVALSFEVEISIPPEASACGGGTGDPVVVSDKIVSNTIGLFPLNYQPGELPEATIMQFRVRTICIEGFSEYSPYVIITKPLNGTNPGGGPETECNTPPNPSVGHDRQNNVCLHWDDAGGALYYDLCIDGALYKSIPNTRGDFQYCNCFCFKEGDLSIGNHTFQVRTVCEGGYSLPTAEIPFFVNHREYNNSIEEGTSGISSIFPNPSSGKVAIEYFGNNAGTLQLKVYDVNGQVVFSETKDVEQGMTSTFEFHLSDLTSGIYLLEARNRMEVSSKKFVLLR